MARIVKEPALRRTEILDSAQRLVYSKGFDQMTIQDILDDLHISKGAFYHYFESKQVLLEALIGRMAEAGEQLIKPILTDPGLNALQKLQCYFDSSMRWKTAQKTFLIALLHGWYSDDNAVVRQKELAAGKKIIVPLIKGVLYQGIAEGLLATPYPEQTAEVLVALILSLGDTLAEVILAGQAGGAELARVEATAAAYAYAMERVLGVAPASLKLIDMEAMKEWFI